MNAKRNLSNAGSGVTLTPTTHSAEPQRRPVRTENITTGQPQPDQDQGKRARVPAPHEQGNMSTSARVTGGYENRATLSGGNRTRTASPLWALPRESQCFRSFRDDGGRCEKNIPARP